MYQLEEAISILKKNIDPKKEMLELPIGKSLGHVLAKDEYAPISVPSFPKSAMDGYAVMSSDLTDAAMDHPAILKVIGELCAGEYKEFAFEPKEAVRVMTGAIVPAGFDTVVRQEDTDYGEEDVKIYTYVKQYQNYCHIGEDIQKGHLILKKGTKLQSLHIGLLASLGYATVQVIQPLNVAIISTGTELINPGTVLNKAQIYNSISYSLAAKIEASRLKVVSSEICSDNISAITRSIKTAVKKADIVITTGGVSVGKSDYIPEFIQRTEAQYLFKGIDVQPGAPTSASIFRNKIILHLSGNPYAALTLFELLFWPVAARFMMNKSLEIGYKEAVLFSEYKKRNKCRRFVRAFEENNEVTIPSAIHVSSVISNLVECNCFIDMEAGKQYKAGDQVRIWRIKEI